MHSRFYYPGHSFLLLFIVMGVVLLKNELNLQTDSPVGHSSVKWVYIVDPEFGADYYSIKSDENLGRLISTVLPPLAPLLTDSCKQAALEEGVQIHLRKASGSEQRDCSIFPMQEQCRYLMGLPLNINLAEEEELILLPGIGNKLAKKIIRQREIKGLFSSSDELSEISGIGMKLLKRLEGCLTI